MCARAPRGKDIWVASGNAVLMGAGLLSEFIRLDCGLDFVMGISGKFMVWRFGI